MFVNVREFLITEEEIDGGAEWLVRDLDSAIIGLSGAAPLEGKFVH